MLNSEMTIENSAKSIDANILLDYILQSSLRDQDRKNKVTKLFHPANKGNWEIRIFVYTLGEVFKRLLGERDGKSEDFGDSKIQIHLKEVQRWVGEKSLVLVKIDDFPVEDFRRHYKEIDRKDLMIQQGDKLVLSAFCADKSAKSFYSSDRGIIQSTWLQEYVSKLGKKIQEP